MTNVFHASHSRKMFCAFILALLLALTPLAAHATVLFVGGEDSDFINLNGAAASTASGTFSSSYARESMAVPTGSCNNTVPPTSYFMTPTFTASSGIWVHANIDNSTLTNGCNGVTSDVLRVYSPDGYARIAITQPTTISGGSNYTLLTSMTTPQGCSTLFIEVEGA
jgi:hypothetical protein